MKAALLATGLLLMKQQMTLKHTDEMTFFVPDVGTLKASNSTDEFRTVQPNEYKGLALKCPISVEEGTGGGGDIHNIYYNHITNYRNLFITPQREIHFHCLKLDRALLLDNRSFYKTSYSKITKDKDQAVLDNLVRQYITSLDNKRIHLKKYRAVIDMLVANLIQGFFSKRLLLIDRHNGAPIENNPINLDNRLIANVCDWLSREGYIELLIQPEQLPSNVNLAQSSLYATEKLIRKVINYRVIQGGSHLLIRDDNKKPIKISKMKSVQLKVKRYEQTLEDYLGLVSNYLFTLDGLEVPVHGRRIFNRNINLGGRFYSNYQNVPSNDRKRIKINHEKTIELDYKSLHYNLLYSMAGHEFKGDPYDVEGYDRASIKVISFQLLNTEGQDGLKELARMITLSGKPEQIEAVRQYDIQRGIYERHAQLGLRVEPPYKPKNVNYHIDLIPEGTDGQQLVNDLLERHKPISQFIGSKDIGLRLQNMDSNIMMDVMKVATGEGMPLLFVHDSCICKYADRARVKDVMQQAYNDVTGFSIGVTQPKRRKK